MLDAVFVSMLLIAINLVLRPLSRYIDQRSLAVLDSHTLYRIRMVCDTESRTEAEYQVTRAVAARSLVLRDLRVERLAETDNFVVQAILESSTHDVRILDTMADELRALPWAQSVEWTETSAEAE